MWRVQKGKVGEQEVEQSGGEGVLRGEAVFEGKAPAMSERCDFRDHAAGLGRGAGTVRLIFSILWQQVKDKEGT